MRIFTTSALLLIAAIQPVLAASYCRADIFMGKASFCEGEAEVKNFPVRQGSGEYLDCDIFMGNVSNCRGSSNRKLWPVRQPDGTYENCNIFMGKARFCQGASDVKAFHIERN